MNHRILVRRVLELHSAGEVDTDFTFQVLMGVADLMARDLRSSPQDPRHSATARP
jgi:hypothetical protein